METNRNYVGSKGPIEGPTKKQDWCARCEKLNVDHLGECPFEKEDWRKGCGHASQRCIMCGECIEKLLSTQEEKIRKEERKETIKLIKDMWEDPDSYALTDKQTREPDASYLDPNWSKFSKGYDDCQRQFLELLNKLNNL